MGQHDQLTDQYPDQTWLHAPCDNVPKAQCTSPLPPLLFPPHKPGANLPSPVPLSISPSPDLISEHSTSE